MSRSAVHRVTASSYTLLVTRLEASSTVSQSAEFLVLASCGTHLFWMYVGLVVYSEQPKAQYYDMSSLFTKLTVRVQPKASRNACSVEADGRVRIALTAPPVDGAANSALVAFVADLLDMPKRYVRLAGGEKSRDKTILIEGLDLDAVLGRLRRGG